MRREHAKRSTVRGVYCELFTVGASDKPGLLVALSGRSLARLAMSQRVKIGYVRL